jgi:outer membrane protein TolC
VILDVRRAARNMRSATEALEAAERRRIAQEETLRAEEERLRLGDSTPFEVLEFEEDLAEAERQEIFALQTYRNAIADLERAQGTLLETRSISLETELTR